MSSTLEKRFARSAADISAMEASIMASRRLNDLRHEIEPVLDRRSQLLVTGSLISLRDIVRAKRKRRVLRVRHRLDAGRVHGGELVDEAEDRRELRAHFLGVRRVDFDPRQVRDPVNVVKGDGHG